jgi:ABC-2 type transport system permease protein
VHAALAIAARDLRQKVRDRSAIILSVVAPFTLAYLFSVMLPSADASFSTRWALADLDGGPVAAQLLAGPIDGIRSAGVAEIERVATEEDVRARVADGTTGAGIVIPAGFSDAVAAGRPAELRVIGSPDAVLSAQVARAVLRGFADRIGSVQLSVATALLATSTIPDAALSERLAQEALALPDPVTVVEARTADRLAATPTFYGASMAVLFVFFAAQFGVVSLLAEKRAGTLSRMLAAPISPQAVLAGKVVVSIVLATVSMTIIAVGTSLLLGASWGDPIAVAALILATAIAASGIALLAVGFAHTEEQAGSVIAIVAITLAVIGGAFFPMTQAPEVLVRLSLLTPQAWFLRGINDLAGGEGIAVVLPSLVVLLAIGAITGGLGMLRARKVVVG